jgi:hypothetical protein
MINVVERVESAAPVPLRFRLVPKCGAWHLTEESSGAVGGTFASLAVALAYVCTDAQPTPGSSVLVELTDGPRRIAIGSWRG